VLYTFEHAQGYFASGFLVHGDKSERLCGHYFSPSAAVRSVLRDLIIKPDEEDELLVMQRQRELVMS
jgi:hypothetical protein